MRPRDELPGFPGGGVVREQINLYFFQYLIGGLRGDKISGRKLNIIAIYKA